MEHNSSAGACVLSAEYEVKQIPATNTMAGNTSQTFLEQKNCNEIITNGLYKRMITKNEWPNMVKFGQGNFKTVLIINEAKLLKTIKT